MVTQLEQEKKKTQYTLSTVYLYFSQYCNLRCRHCWIDPQFSTERSTKSGEADIKVIISALEECRQLGMTSIKVTGGEPFLREDIFELLSYCKNKNIGLVFETNGTLIKEREAKALRETNVNQVAVSLDGPNAEIHQLLRGVVGSFDETITGIRLLKKYNINTQVIISLWRKNKDYIKSTIDLSRSLGVDSVKINIVSCVARADRMSQEEEILSVKEVIDFYNDLRKELEKEAPFYVNFDIPSAFQPMRNGRLEDLNTCGILGILGILGDGRISICGIGTSLDALVLGRIGQDRIEDIWNSHPVLEKIRSDIPYKLEGVCGKCILRYYCLGKCRAEAYYNRGSLVAPLSFCQKAYEQGLFPASRLQEAPELERYITKNKCVITYSENGSITTCLSDGKDYIKLKDFDLWLWNKLDNADKVSISEVESEAKGYEILKDGKNIKERINELVEKEVLFYVEDKKDIVSEENIYNQKLKKYQAMRDNLFRELNSVKNFGNKEDLSQFHRHSIKTTQGHFETKEITVSHLFREKNPALGGQSYGTRLFQQIDRYKKLRKNIKILDVGAGLGFASCAFLKSLEEKYPELINDISYVFCDLTFKFLESQREQTASYSTKFIQTNAERLPFKDNSFDIIIANENIADFAPVKLNKKDVLDFLNGKLAIEKIRDVSIKKALEWIKLCSIDISNALPEFIFNLGAFEFVNQISKVLKDGGLAFICEYGVWNGYPQAVSLFGHTEYAIQFPQLISCIKSLGMEVEIFSLKDFLGFDIEKKTIDRCSLNFLREILKKQNIYLPFLAYTKDMLEERLPINVLANFSNLKFKKIKEELNFYNLKSFYVLLIRKKGGGVWHNRSQSINLKRNILHL